MEDIHVPLLTISLALINFLSITLIGVIGYILKSLVAEVRDIRITVTKLLAEHNIMMKHHGNLEDENEKM